MPYQVNCPSCGQLHRLTDEHIGISVQCTKCERPFVYDEPIREAKARERQLKLQAKDISRREREARGATIGCKLRKWWQAEKLTEQRRREAAEKRRDELRQNRRAAAIAEVLAESRMRANPHKRLGDLSETTLLVIGWLIVFGVLWGAATTTVVMVAGVVLTMLACTLAILMSLRRHRVEHQYFLEAILEELRMLHEQSAAAKNTEDDHNAGSA